MTETLGTIIAAILLVSGALTIIISAIGLLRFPDFYARLHAAGITDTLGAWQVLAGMMVVIGPSLPAFKLGLIGLFLFFTAPTSSYAIANAAWLDTRVPKPPAMKDPSFRKGNATE